MRRVRVMRQRLLKYVGVVSSKAWNKDILTSGISLSRYLLCIPLNSVSSLCKFSFGLIDVRRCVDRGRVLRQTWSNTLALYRPRPYTNTCSSSVVKYPVNSTLHCNFCKPDFQNVRKCNDSGRCAWSRLVTFLGLRISPCSINLV